MKQRLKFLFLLLLPIFSSAQSGTLSGVVLDDKSNQPISDAIVYLNENDASVFTNVEGAFSFDNVAYGEVSLAIRLLGKNNLDTTFLYQKSSSSLVFLLSDWAELLDQVVIETVADNDFGKTHLKSIEGTAIYESKKSEVILLKDMTANLSTNNARQVFAKITGLNIWESDGAGLQLGIGGRGLSPNRTANFNTRQNGYDISADALGYPENYYTPPTEALKKIEIIRGASSLQYGTQFGGMLNFVFKKGPENRKIEVTSRQTVGSWGFLGSFNSAGGTVGKLNYYTFYQRKQGNGWRPNSAFEQDNFYIDLDYQFSEKLSVDFNYTHSNYTAQQAGGLTDAMFKQDPRQSVRSRNWFDVNWNLAALTFDWKLSPQTTINSRTFILDAGRSSLGNLERINVADLGGNRTLIEGSFENLGNETRLLHRYNLGKQFGAFVVGSRIYSGITSARQGDGSDGSDADFRFMNPSDLENSDFRFPNKNYAVFIENIFNISDKLSITPGLRWENIQTFSEGYFRQRVFDFAGNIVSDQRVLEDLARKRSFLIAGIGASYRQSDDTEVYANFSQNYRAINFTDLRIVNPNFAVDPDIEDETGFTADLGLRGKKGKWLSYDITAFYVAYNGRIGQILRADQPPLFLDYRLRTNVSDARNIGLESFVELDMLKLWNKNAESSFSWFVNGALIDARYINTSETSILNKKVEMVPPVMIRTGLNFRSYNFCASLQYSYVGEHFTDATNAVRTATAVEGIIPSYQVVDLSACYHWRRLSLEGSINNLLNEMYFTRRAEAYPGPGIIPSDGRGFYVTLMGRF